MAWSLDGKRIYTQKIVEGTKQIIASLQPLAEGTVYQTFGYETAKVKIGCLVVGSGILASLHLLTTTGVSVELMSPDPTTDPPTEISLGHYYVSSISADREKAIYQTIDTDQDCSAPVYNVDIELFKDLD
jgi:hypothetical protein